MVMSVCDLNNARRTGSRFRYFINRYDTFMYPLFDLATLENNISFVLTDTSPDL